MRKQAEIQAKRDTQKTEREKKRITRTEIVVEIPQWDNETNVTACKGGNARNELSRKQVAHTRRQELEEEEEEEMGENARKQAIDRCSASESPCLA